MEYPYMIQLELTSFCNARCDFCLIEQRERKAQMMDNNLFKKIIEECKTFPLQKICPFLHGEPFIDNSFIDKLQYINEQLPEVHFDIFSNMEVAIPEKIDGLSTIKNIDSFVMSISGYDKESAYRHQKVDWNKVFTNVNYLINKNLNNRFIKKIEIVAMSYDNENKSNYEKLWKNKVGVDNFFFTCKQNWLGESNSNISLNLNKVCQRAFHFNILSNGQVVLCCWDAFSQFPIGDLNKQTILEIYNSEYYKKFRTLQKKELFPCNRCSE